MVNCNPETVSTDYDTSTASTSSRSARRRCSRSARASSRAASSSSSAGRRRSSSRGARGRRLRDPRHAVRSRRPRGGPRALRRSVRRARHRVSRRGGTREPGEAIEIAEEIGYPVLVRPSYVLGGREHARLLRPRRSRAAAEARPRPVDRFLEGAVEIDVDALCDGAQTFVAAVMEHVEEAACTRATPPASCRRRRSRAAHATRRGTVRQLAPALGVVGLVNVQLAVVGDELYVLEANPRASRTVPFASKAIGVNLVDAACRLAAGAALADLDLEPASGRATSRSRRRSSLRRFPGADPVLGPEMRSTGEVMASAATSPRRSRRPSARRGGRSRRRHGVPLGPRRRQGGGRRARPTARRPRLRALRDRGNGARARGGRAAGRRACARWGGGRRRDRRRPRPPPALRPRRQHTGRAGRALGRLPHPRGGARRARPVHHDARGAFAAVEAIARARSEDAVSSRSELRRELLDVVRVDESRPVPAAAPEARAARVRDPGQFFMLAPPGRLLPRPMSLCLRPGPSSASSSTRSGPGRARSTASAAATAPRLGPLGNGFRLDVERPLLVGGGIGSRPSRTSPSGSAGRRPCSASARRRTPRRRRSCRTPRSWSSRRLVTEAHARPRRPRLRAGADARAVARSPRRAARLGGADGLRLRRVLRLRGRDRRRAQAPLRRRACPGATRRDPERLRAASTRSPRPEVAQSLDAFVTKT
jgi:hypothetical protein